MKEVGCCFRITLHESSPRSFCCCFIIPRWPGRSCTLSVPRPPLRPVACCPSQSRALSVRGRTNELLLLVLGIYPGAHWPLNAPRRLRGLLPCIWASLEFTELTPRGVGLMKKHKWQRHREEASIGWKYELRCRTVPITHGDALSKWD